MISGICFSERLEGCREHLHRKSSKKQKPKDENSLPAIRRITTPMRLDKYRKIMNESNGKQAKTTKNCSNMPCTRHSTKPTVQEKRKLNSWPMWLKESGSAREERTGCCGYRHSSCPAHHSAGTDRRRRRTTLPRNRGLRRTANTAPAAAPAQPAAQQLQLQHQPELATRSFHRWKVNSSL